MDPWVDLWYTYVSSVFLRSYLDNAAVRCLGKGGKERIVPVTLRTADHLSQYISVYHSGSRPDTNLLFFTVIKNTANAMSEGNVERLLSNS